MNSKIELARIDLICRSLLSFLFIYHGLVPKILWLSPTEASMITGSGIEISASYIAPLAGAFEIALGCIIAIYSKSNTPIYAADITLPSLLIYVTTIQPHLLVEAFNPATTNILGLGLCYLTITLNKTSS